MGVYAFIKTEAVEWLKPGRSDSENGGVEEK